MADLGRIKNNVAKMASMNAPREDIDGYISSEGVTIDDVRNFKMTPIAQTQPTQSMGISDLAAEYVGRPIARAARTTAAGVASLGDLANLPVNAALGLAGTQYRFGSPSEDIKRAFDIGTEGTRLSTAPRNAAERIVDTAGEFVTSAGPIGAAAKVANLAKKLSPSTIKELQALIGAGVGSGVASEVAPESILAQIVGTIGGGLAPAATKGTLSAVGSTVVPKLSKEMKNTVQLAQKYDIPLGLDQITGSKSRQFLTSTSGRIPFSGGQELADIQQRSLNRAALKTVGIDAEKVAIDAVDEAYRNIGQQFNEVLGGKVLGLTEAQRKKFDAILDSARKTVSKDKVQAIKSNIDEILTNFDENGTIRGEILGDLRSTLAARMKDADPGIKQHIGKILDNVMDISAEGNPESRALLTTAKYNWKNLKTLEPLLAKAEGGDIRPALLKGQVLRSYGGKALATGKAGELGELVKIADVIKSKIGDSGTAERNIAYRSMISVPQALVGGAAGAGGAAAAGLPATLAGLGVTIGGAKAYQAYNASQKIVNAALRRAAKDLKELPSNAGRKEGILTQEMQRKVKK